MTHEELVEKIAASLTLGTRERRREEARVAIAAVAEALLAPTDEMSFIGDKASPECPSHHCDTKLELAVSRTRPVWRAMLSASPLFPKDQRAR